MNLKKNASIIAAAAALSLAAGASWAQDVKGGSSALLANGSTQVNNPVVTPAEGMAAVCYSFEGLESWDGEDDGDSITLELNIGAGNSLTGVAFDLGIATVGGSWLSEATIRHSDSTGAANPDRIYLTPAVGEDAPGDADFSSGGVIDFTDNGLPDIAVGGDGILQLHLFETFVDNADAVDANYRNAAAPAVCPGLRLVCSNQGACDGAVTGLPQSQPVPVNSPWALALLVLVLAGLGVVAVRRFA